MSENEKPAERKEMTGSVNRIVFGAIGVIFGLYGFTRYEWGAFSAGGFSVYAAFAGLITLAGAAYMWKGIKPFREPDAPPIVSVLLEEAQYIFWIVGAFVVMWLTAVLVGLFS